MNAHIKRLVAASALSATAIIPASADYSILEDSSLPSVVFIEFDGYTAAPKVISADAPNVISADPALPSSGGSEGSSTQASTSGEPSKSVEDRVNERIAELENTGEDSVGDDTIDDLKNQPMCVLLHATMKADAGDFRAL
ncbi:hypothetical protein GQR58_028034 [Nymphon striatum]|nr:hypothetical protein GQR58_028034 [Nymphon striatum]